MVQTERRGAVLWLTLNRPEVGNALDPSLIGGMGTALAAAARDELIKLKALAFGGEAHDAPLEPGA